MAQWQGDGLPVVKK